MIVAATPAELAQVDIAHRDLHWHSQATNLLRQLDGLAGRAEDMERALKVISTWAACNVIDRDHVTLLVDRALGRSG